MLPCRWQMEFVTSPPTRRRLSAIFTRKQVPDHRDDIGMITEIAVGITVMVTNNSVSATVIYRKLNKIRDNVDRGDDLIASCALTEIDRSMRSSSVTHVCTVAPSASNNLIMVRHQRAETMCFEYYREE